MKNHWCTSEWMPEQLHKKTVQFNLSDKFGNHPAGLGMFLVRTHDTKGIKVLIVAENIVNGNVEKTFVRYDLNQNEVDLIAKHPYPLVANFHLVAK